MSGRKIGYTRRQAERLKYAIDRDVAKVEDTLSALAHRVSDTNASGFTFVTELEVIHRYADDLKAVVDRRTRDEGVPDDQ